MFLDSAMQMAKEALGIDGEIELPVMKRAQLLPKCRGTYLQGVITLDDSIDVYSPLGFSILLHEMVHYLQDHSKYPKANLVNTLLSDALEGGDYREYEALLIQDEYLSFYGLKVLDIISFGKLVEKIGPNSARKIVLREY